MKKKKILKNALESAGLTINKKLKRYELQGYDPLRGPHFASFSVDEEGNWRYSNVRQQQVELYIPKKKKGKGYTDRAAMQHRSTQKTNIWVIGPAKKMTNKEFFTVVKAVEAEINKP